MLLNPLKHRIYTIEENLKVENVISAMKSCALAAKKQEIVVPVITYSNTTALIYRSNSVYAFARIILLKT